MEKINIENKALFSTLGRVALPIALQSLISSSLGLVDSLMVGHLGETQLAAVGLSAQIFLVHWGILFGFGSGSSAFMAQFWGKKDLPNVKKVAGFAIFLCLSVSLFFVVPGLFFPGAVLRLFTNIPEAIALGSQYIKIGAVCFLLISVTVPLTAALRATQQASIPLKVSLVTFSTNTFLCYVLIYGKFGAPALGVKGAAVAMVVARTVELSLTLYVIFGRKNILAGNLREFFGWPKVFVRRILMAAVPVMVNEGMWSAGMATYNAAYGRTDVTQFAAIQASSTINQLFVMAIFSLGDALLILVGQRIGMGQNDYAYALAKKLLKIGVAVGVISGGLLIFSSRFILQLFNFTPEGVRYATLILCVYGLFMPIKVFGGLNIVGTLRCGGDTRFAMILEVCSVWLIGVPLVFAGVGYFHLPIYLVVLMAQAEEVTKSVICFFRFRSKRWLNNLVQNLS